MSFVKLLAIVRRRSLVVALGTLLTMLAILLVVRPQPIAEEDLAAGTNYVSVGIVKVQETAVPPIGTWTANAALTELQNIDLYDQIANEVGYLGNPEELRSKVDFVVGSPILDDVLPAVRANLRPNEPISALEERVQSLNRFFEASVADLPIVMTARVVDPDPAVAQRFAEGAAVSLARLGNELQIVEYDRFENDLTTQVVETTLLVSEFEEQQGPEGMARIQNPQTPEDVVLGTLYQTYQENVRSSEASLSSLATFAPIVTGDLYEVLVTPRPRELPTDGDDGAGGNGFLTTPVGRLLLGFFLGLVASSVLAVVVERLFPRMDTRADVEDALGLSVIAEVPLVTRQIADRRISLDTFDGPDAEMYRSLRSTLEFLSQAKGRSRGATTEVIMVVSATPAEGKTRSAAMLGMSYAESGYKVALFGCDFRRPRIHEMVNAEREPGIGTLVEPGGEHLEFDDIIQATETPGLFMVASGAPTRRTVPSNAVVEQLIGEARRADTNVVIDTAPILVANDSTDLLHLVDHVVFVVRSGKTASRAAQEALAVLERHEAKVAGVVLIGAPANDGSYYSYYRRYGYYYGRPAGESESEVKAVEAASSESSGGLMGRLGRNKKSEPEVSVGVSDSMDDVDIDS